MINRFFTNRALQRLHAGPLGPYIDTFATLLSERGYTRWSARFRIRLVAQMSQWLHRRGIDVNGLDEQKIVKFLKYQQRQKCVQHRGLRTLRLLLQQLQGLGVIPYPTLQVDDSDLGRIERRFTQYLTQQRGLSQATLKNTLPMVRRFLAERFGTGTILLADLRPPDITRFVLRYAHTMSPSRAKLMVTALRSFFRFLRQNGEIATDLAAAVPTVANWRLSTLPKSLEPEQIEHLLKSCDQSSVIGQRDYAVLLLLARLGLRAGEVVAMTLDDIDWEAGELIVRGKGPRRNRLPILHEVGEALVRYLRYGRPHCLTRRVFVRMSAPRQGFSSSTAIGDIVRRALDRTGLHPAHKSANLLRHSLATQMLRKGASLAEIGQILGHRLPNTTEIYAKTNLAALSTLAQPWPGGDA